jgi:hypothetical protein
LLAALAGLFPNALVATTVNVYAVPFVNPLTVIGEEVSVAVTPPGLDVTVYPVIAPPPTLSGAVKATDAEALPPVAVPIVGASGNFNPL